MNMPCNTYNL